MHSQTNNQDNQSSTLIGGNQYEQYSIKQLEEKCGTLSVPSKMPCYGYSLPAALCKKGSKLREIEGSVCYGCYAHKGRYIFNGVQSALLRRYNALMGDRQVWRLAITELIRRKEKSGYFRWHDSGDLQDLQHLIDINTIALRLPHIKFWLPTREYDIVKRFRGLCGGQDFATNLSIRLSATMVGSSPPTKRYKLTSTVDWNDAPHNCPAPTQQNQCQDCRACWDTSIPNVNYKLH